MKTQLAVLFGCLLATGFAHAYKVGDQLQFVGVDKNGGTCAVQFKIGQPHGHLPNHESLVEIGLFTTKQASRHFGNSSSFSDYSVAKVESRIWGRYYEGSYEGRGSPDGFDTRTESSSIILYGESLEKVTHVDASDWVKYVFSSNRGGDFTCTKMQAAQPEALAAALARIKAENKARAEAIAKKQAERAAAAEKKEAAERAEAAKEQKRIDEARLAEQAERERNEPARRAKIDADRKAQGLAPIDWSTVR